MRLGRCRTGHGSKAGLYYARTVVVRVIGMERGAPAADPHVDAAVHIDRLGGDDLGPGTVEVLVAHKVNRSIRAAGVKLQQRIGTDAATADIQDAVVPQCAHLDDVGADIVAGEEVDDAREAVVLDTDRAPVRPERARDVHVPAG